VAAAAPVRADQLRSAGAARRAAAAWGDPTLDLWGVVTRGWERRADDAEAELARAEEDEEEAQRARRRQAGLRGSSSSSDDDDADDNGGDGGGGGDGSGSSGGDDGTDVSGHGVRTLRSLSPPPPPHPPQRPRGGHRHSTDYAPAPARYSNAGGGSGNGGLSVDMSLPPDPLSPQLHGSGGAYGATDVDALAPDNGDGGGGAWDARALAHAALAQPDAQLAVATTDGALLLVDAATGALVRSFTGHRAGLRVGALAWGAPTLLASGGRDRVVVLHDVRAPRPLAWLSGHVQEICGLDWARGGGGAAAPWMLASGGNDNKVCVWNVRMLSGSGGGAGGDGSGGGYRGEWAVESRPMCTLRGHRAAVKALAWSPHVPGLLATGGGTADRCIRLWDVFADDGCGVAALGTGASGPLGAAVLAVADTGSQVCRLAWSPSRRGELYSSHGFSRHHIAVWRAPQLEPVAVLRGHSARVLHLAVRPDGNLMASAAGGPDGTVRLWELGAGGPGAGPAWTFDGGCGYDSPLLGAATRGMGSPGGLR
jgi:cell division cycle 20-like protein 1 (cofactor of APC complex)